MRFFCRKADEFDTRDHLFLKCEALLPFRKDVKTWLTVLNNNHDYVFNVNNIWNQGRKWTQIYTML